MVSLFRQCKIQLQLTGNTDIDSLKTSCGYAKHAFLGYVHVNVRVPLCAVVASTCLSLSCFVAACHSVSGFSKNCFETRMWLAEKKLQVLGTDADALLNKRSQHELNKHSFDTRDYPSRPCGLQASPHL